MPADWIDFSGDPAHAARERARARELRRSEWWRRRIASGRCHYCGRVVAPAALTMDHVVPVARGGFSVKGNVVPSCADCNRSKRFLTPAERALAALEAPANRVLRAGADNFVHLVADAARAVVVDPGEAAPVLAALRQGALRLEAVLLTHRHADHTGGCAELREVTGCAVIGPAECAVAGLDRTVAGGETLATGVAAFDVLATPGHTLGHVVYHAPALHGAWTGDTLFSAGCGRAIEAPARVLWESLLRLRRLPPATRIWGGHDYTLDNLDFALSLLPRDQACTIRRAATLRLAARGRAPTGAALREECRSNIFLRADGADVAAALGMAGAAPDAVFVALRALKDDW
jgi:hydroxyacylglutathione hydrolase